MMNFLSKLLGAFMGAFLFDLAKEQGRKFGGTFFMLCYATYLTYISLFPFQLTTTRQETIV